MATSHVVVSDLKIISAGTIIDGAMTDRVSAAVVTIEEDLIIEEEEEVVVVIGKVSEEMMATKEIRGIRRLISRVVKEVDLVIEEKADLEAVVAEVAEDSIIEAEMVASIEAEVVIIIGIAEVTSTEAEDTKNPSDQTVAMVRKIRKLNLTIKL